MDKIIEKFVDIYVKDIGWMQTSYTIEVLRSKFELKEKFIYVRQEDPLDSNHHTDTWINIDYIIKIKE